MTHTATKIFVHLIVSILIINGTVMAQQQGERQSPPAPAGQFPPGLHPEQVQPIPLITITSRIGTLPGTTVIPSRIAQTYIVSDSGDAGDSNPGDGLFAPPTLRSAIENAELTPELDVIVFATYIKSIRPTSQLPVAQKPVVIDGYLDGTNTVILDGSLAPGAAGLQLAGGGSAVRNLDVRNFATSGIILRTKDGSAIQGCYIHDNGGTGISIFSSKSNLIGGNGTGLKNTITKNGEHGVAVDASSHANIFVSNLIGTSNGSDPAPNKKSGILLGSSDNIIYANLISGNGDHGIETTSADPLPSRNIIQSNFIGTGGSGLAPLPNSRAGIFLAAGKADTISFNVISGNTGDGISFGSATGKPATGLVIYGNSIGTDLHGKLALANNSGIAGAGQNIWIGYNLISGNRLSGISASGKGWSILTNRIGTDSAGTAALPNSADGVSVVSGPADSTANIVIGGGAVSNGNIISGNSGNGIKITGPMTKGIAAVNNILGANLPSSTVLPNKGSGVLLSDGTYGNYIASNLISGNGQHGIRVEPGTGSSPYASTFRANLIGVNAAAAPLGNTKCGISIDNSFNNLLGGTDSLAGNIVSGNGTNGIELLGAASRNNWIQGNLVGIGSAAGAALPNGMNGISITGGNNNLIGGTAYRAGNVFSGNKQHGILITNSDSNAVQGNFIGTDAAGKKAVANQLDGISLTNTRMNLIGGIVPEAGNTISGNLHNGITLYQSRGNWIFGNLVGASVTGNQALANKQHGIALQSSSSNAIGGDDAGSGNIISGNSGNGCWLSVSDSNFIGRNFIGTDIQGMLQLGNGSNGVRIDSSKTNNVGAAGKGNTIAYNAGCGILLTSGTSDAFSENSIFSNKSPGIDLGGDGITKNDTLDTDIGPNQRQNFPVLAYAYTGAQLLVSGWLNTTETSTYRLEFFANDSCDASKNGEGKTFLGAFDVYTDAKGTASFKAPLAVAVSQGKFITATATDGVGNTSEFSPCAEVVPPPVTGDLELTMFAVRDTLMVGDTAVFRVVVWNYGPDAAMDVRVSDTLSSTLSYIDHNATRGSASYSAGVVLWTIGSLAKDDSTALVIRARATAVGMAKNSAVVRTPVFDNEPSNNSASQSVVVKNSTGIDVPFGTPGQFELMQNYPNPFSDRTSIRFVVPEQASGQITLLVYDALGREVATLFTGSAAPGMHEAEFRLPSGQGSSSFGKLFFYRLVTAAGNITRKMVSR